MTAMQMTISASDKILIVAPHPDDECIGVGGILSLFPEQCTIIVLTDGSKGNDTCTQQEEYQIRKKQFEEEMEYLGILSYRLVGKEDGNLLKEHACMDNVDFSRFTKVFIPNIDDDHPDHTAAFWYTVKEIKRQKIRNIEVYQYEVHLPLQRVTHYVDITNCIEQKCKLIGFHKDQIKINYIEAARSLARYRACRIGKPDNYVETYFMINIGVLPEYQMVYKREENLLKYQKNMQILVLWLTLVQQGKCIGQDALTDEVKRVSIYGFSDLGRLLYKTLKKRGLNIVEVLDNRKVEVEGGLKTINPAEGNRNSDMIIVTAVFDFEKIKTDLEMLGYRNVVSLEQFV